MVKYNENLFTLVYVPDIFRMFWNVHENKKITYGRSFISLPFAVLISVALRTYLFFVKFMVQISIWWTPIAPKCPVMVSKI